LKLRKLIREHVCLRYEVKICLAVLFLHTSNVNREPILPSELETVGEMVDLLELVQSLVEVGLALGVGPEDVPVVAVSATEAVYLKEVADELGFAFKQFVEA